jgi:hypothetical protein
MKPLSSIVIYFRQNYGRGQYVPLSVLTKFSKMDLDMLVDFGILVSYRDHYHGITYYRIRLPRKAVMGTKMIYSQRVQYAKDWQQRKRAA